MANTVYNNKVIEAKAKDLLTTTLNSKNLMTIDDSLVESEGMTKTINVYTYTGEVEVLNDGEKNTTRGSISHVGTDYVVKRAQQVFDYTDSDFMKDENVVDMSLRGANQVMINKMMADFLVEAKKATNKVEFAKNGKIGYDIVVDAISELNLEDEKDIFILMPNTWKANLRKDEDFKTARQGELIYGGQIGTICGIPVVVTKALTDTAYVMTKAAIKLFMKKDLEIEQDRDIETKKNSVVMTSYYICALVDNSKICKIIASAT